MLKEGHNFEKTKQNTKGLPFKNYQYIAQILKKVISCQIFQKYISSNELNSIHFCCLKMLRLQAIVQC